MTHGPAINTSGLLWPKALNSIGTGILRLRLQFGFHFLWRGLRRLRGVAPPAVFVSRPDERLEQRMRLHGFGFELGMELAAQEPGMVRDLADLDVGVVRAFRP